MNIPAWLLVFFAIVTGICLEVGLNITFTLNTKPDSPSCFAVAAESSISYSVYCSQIFIYSFYSFTGRLADTKIVRKRAISFSLWSCWFGTLLQCFSYCIHYGTLGLYTS